MKHVYTYLLLFFVTFSLTNAVAKNVCCLCNTKTYFHQLFESESFWVLGDSYPVYKNHILITPKNHKLSFSVIDREMEHEFEALIKTVCEVLDIKEYGLFEHGSNMVGIEQKGCGNSVYHAHMHIVPNLNLNQEEVIQLCTQNKNNCNLIAKNECDFKNCCSQRKDQTILHYLQELPTERPYLFCYYSHSKKEALCIPDDLIEGGVPSQFFRKIFAHYFQKNAQPFWNWKDEKEVKRGLNFIDDATKETIEKFKDQEAITKIFLRYINN